MMYLVEHLSLWLFLTAVFAGIAGWAFAAQRDAPREASLRRQRDTLVADLGRLAAGEGGGPQPAMADPRQSLADIGNGRLAELERDRDQARARASEALARIAELERRLEQQAEATVHPLVSTPVEEASAAPLQLAALPEPSSPTPDESEVLQNWRLRYFEQRVRYLEERASGAEQAAPAQPLALAAPAVEASPTDAWRAREAEARATFLEQQLRAREAAPASAEPIAEVAPDSPFASNAEVDALLRWRMLYLERRLAYAQEHAERPVEAAAEQVMQPLADTGPDLDRWKWRARYLESRVRHLTSRLEAAPVAQPQALAAAVPATNGDAQHAPPPAPSVPTERPPSLPAPRNGAPDDFTLIDGVSGLQQSTLNSLGVYHFDQIAAWTPANVAWVDQYLRLRGRIAEEEWVEQADELAHETFAGGANPETSVPRL